MRMYLVKKRGLFVCFNKTIRVETVKKSSLKIYTLFNVKPTKKSRSKKKQFYFGVGGPEVKQINFA